MSEPSEDLGRPATCSTKGKHMGVPRDGPSFQGSEHRARERQERWIGSGSGPSLKASSNYFHLHPTCKDVGKHGFYVILFKIDRM